MAFEIFRPLQIFLGKIITAMSEKTGLAVLPANSSCTVHSGEFYLFFVRWIYYSHRLKTGKSHHCALQ